MNVNRLYVAQIYINTGINDDFNYVGKYVKNAVVYNSNNGFIDLCTKEKYKLGINKASDGQLYINFSNGLKPLYDSIDIDFEREHMGRKRIIKKIANSKLLSEKEDDK